MDPADIGEVLPKVLRKYNAQPLPTVFDGVAYRSRLEARWSVFFKSLGIRAEYEPEGYDLKGTWYLPDFWLPELKIFVEIKPDEPVEVETDKAQLLAEGTGYPVYSFYDPIQLDGGHITLPKAFVAYPLEGADAWQEWCECPDCGALGIRYCGYSDRLPCKIGTNKPTGCPTHSENRSKHSTSRSPKILRAYQAFIGARFHK